MSEFEPGRRVEWRSDGGIARGVYVEPDEGFFASFSVITTGDDRLLVRSCLLHPEGVLAAQDVELADLARRAQDWPIGNDEHAARRRRRRGPWCDTCKRPVVAVEGRGRLHATAEHPFGLPASLDDSGHEVTTDEWYHVPR